MNAKTWKSWLVPGGLLLALVAALVNSPLFVFVAPSLTFYYIAVFAAGFFLAWRFHSSRILFSLLTLLLAHRAVDFFANGQPLSNTVRSGPGHTVVIFAALMVPINFIAFASMRERGLVLAGVVPRAGLLFLEAVAAAVLCRPENSMATSNRLAIGAIPVWAFAGFVAAVATFVLRFLETRKPIEPGFAWSSAAVFLWLQFAPIGKISDVYVATAALILAVSLIETSYVLAYHDELTGMCGRRAFNEALLSLDQHYSIAIVDIDHFKKFNDTYGHHIGDQVLCMVASRLSNVSGNGQAFRCGGEEFAIIFRETSAKDAVQHLDLLRVAIEQSMFRVRGRERRSALRQGEGDRRKPSKRKAASSTLGEPPDRLSVTVSIGVAEASTRNRQPEQVIQAADQALYRAKQKGRNRVELASPAPLPVEKARRAKASRP